MVQSIIMLDPYLDSNGVMRNKLDATDAVSLAKLEYSFTEARHLELKSKQVTLANQDFGLARFKEIHHHLFQDVYDWAGEPRTVSSSKKMPTGDYSIFADPAVFAKNWQAIEAGTAHFISKNDMSFVEKVDALSDIFIYVNHTHVFPEGNGRTAQVFMTDLAAKQGVNLNYSKTNSKDWNLACAVSGSHGRYVGDDSFEPKQPNDKHIKFIFAEIASPTVKHFQQEEQKNISSNYQGYER